MTQTPELSIIIVNWNSARFLERCLESVYANTPGVNLEVLVIDNASYDGAGELLRSKFPQVVFIQSAENLGFARANNAAFRQSRGKYVLFLNPDTEVLGNAIPAMLEALRSAPNAGMMGIKLLNTDRSVQTTSIMRFPSILNEALDFEFLHVRFPGFPVWRIAPLFRESAALVPVDAVSGACMLMPREVFEQAEQFDSGYFMFTEDLDLCFKVKQAGWTVCYFGGASMIHHGGGSTASKPNHFSTVMIQESHFEFIKKRRGEGRAALYRLAMGMVAGLRLAALGTLFAATLGRYQAQRLRWAMEKWAIVFRWALGLEERMRELVPGGFRKENAA